MSLHHYIAVYLYVSPSLHRCLLYLSFLCYSCECYSGYSGDTCDSGCHCMAVVHTCVIHTLCTPSGMCGESGYDCVVQLNNVLALAGAGGGLLVFIAFVLLVMCCGM